MTARILPRNYFEDKERDRVKELERRVEELTRKVKVWDEAIDDLLEHSGVTLCPIKTGTNQYCSFCGYGPGLGKKCLKARKNAAIEAAEEKVGVERVEECA